MTSSSVPIRHRNIRQIIGINVNILAAIGYYYLADWLWPSDPRYWGFGFIAIMVWLASFCYAVKALSKIIALYRKDKMLARFEADIRPQKDAEMASTATLKEAGMIDG